MSSPMMAVHPDEIRACAKKIDQLTATSSQLNNAATANSVPQLSWGALGNLIGLYSNYDELLGQLHDHFTKMGAGFGKLGQALGDTADTYHGNEQVNSQKFNAVMNQMLSSAQAPKVRTSAAASGGGTGLGSSYASQYGLDNVGKSAAKGVPMGSSVYSAVKDGIKLGNDMKSGDGADIASDSAVLVGDMASYVASGAEIASAVADPLNWLISKGLSFLLDVVSPLKQCVDLVTGDPDATSKAADGFKKIGEDTRQLAKTYDDHLRAGLQSWNGDAAESAAKRLSEFHDGIEGSASTAAHVASVLQASSMLMKVAEDVIKGILSDLVEWLVITWLSALALSVVTVGASDAAAAAATPAEAAIASARGASEVNKVRQLIMKIIAFLKKIKAVLDKSAIKAIDKINSTGPGGRAVEKFANRAPEALGTKMRGAVQKAAGTPTRNPDPLERVGEYGDAAKTWADRGAGATKYISEKLDGNNDDNESIDKYLEL